MCILKKIFMLTKIILFDKRFVPKLNAFKLVIKNFRFFNSIFEFC